MQEQIVKALEWRYAVQSFDPSKKVSEGDLKAILESGRLAPSSIGTEPWKFIVVENPELREKIKGASYGQPKVTEASHLIVLARRTDVRENIARERLERTARIQNQPIESLNGLKQMLESNIAGRDDASLDSWAGYQSYIALGMMIETAALLGVDAGPMEGFDSKAVDDILGLAGERLAATSILSLGYRSADDRAASRPKVRRSFDEVVKFMK